MKYGHMARPSGMRLPRYVLGASLAAIAVGLASPAAAQCVTSTTPSGTVIDCTGTDADGVTVTASGAHLTVEPDAQVLAGADAAIINAALSTRIDVDGAVAGGAGGIS
ncbi:hypothetical protein [Sphingomonas sp. DT-204]|uniref:hypothetical protein n=1 Tax=Sphingomonas sp. DT-204 TaxID=3396166 RepID=UPI003F19AD7D